MSTLRTHRGYTLLEMIVSVGIFSVVMLVATAAYLTLIHLDRQSRATTDVMSNLSFAVDSMSRAIRTGSDYCVAGCTSSRFSFIDSEGRRIVYAYTGGTITQQVESGAPAAIVDSRITVPSDGLRFYRWGTAPGAADGQPRITFVIKGSVVPEPGAAPVTFVVQSGATQRLIDL